MNRYKVERVSLFFTNEPQKEFMTKFFTVLYYLEGSKIVMKNFLHNRRQFVLALKLPIAMEIYSQEYARLPSGVPSRVRGPIKLLTPYNCSQTQ